MTLVPLPDVPTMRVRVIGTDGPGNDWGTRFYLSYGGSAPTGANCTTLAGDISSAFSAHLASLMTSNSIMNEVDVLDIATDSGLSGQDHTVVAGTRSGTSMPAQVATNIEYGIARRYRGGKPRAYWPFGVMGDESNVSMWGSSFIGDCNTGIEAFFTAVEALSVGAVGTLTHVNLSYYKGFTNHTSTSGRESAVPTYRATALHDDITGYFTKALISSQRRRRVATTP